LLLLAHTPQRRAEQIEAGHPGKVKARGAAVVCLIQEMNKEKWLRKYKEYRPKEAACE